MMTISVNSAAGAKGNEVNFVTDADGNITGLNGPDGLGWGRPEVIAAVERHTPTYFPLISNIRTADAVTLQSCTVSDVQRTAKNGITLNGVKITPNDSAIGIAHFNIEPRTVASELVGFLIYVDAGKEVDLKFYIDDNATPTKSYAYDWQTFQPGWKFIVPGRPSGAPAGGKWGAIVGSPVFGTTTFTRIRMRCNATTPKTEIEFYGAFELPITQDARPVSRVAFGADDSYSSIYTLGASVFEEYGATLALAPNAPLVGSSGSYMTLAQLTELRDRGHEFICQNTSTTNGFGDWSGDADRKAKIAAELAICRSFLIDNHLCSRGSENVFVYDRDYYKFSDTDTDILDALVAAGFVGARGPRLTTFHGCYRSPFGFDPFGNEVITIGYTWDSTPATDAARIALMLQQINEAAETGRDVFVYIHKVVTTAAAATEISEATLRQFLSAVANNALAGKQRFARHAEIMYDYACRRQPV